MPGVIRQRRNLVLPPPAYNPAGIAGLMAWYKFNEGHGGTLYDYSGNGYHGTVSGATWAYGGLDFTSGGRVALPSGVNPANINTIQALISPNGWGSGGVVLGENNVTSLCSWLIRVLYPVAKFTPTPVNAIGCQAGELIYDGAVFQGTTVFDLVYKPAVVTWQTDAGGDEVYIGTRPAGYTVGPVSTAGLSGRVGPLCIGNDGNGHGFQGRIHSMLIYSTELNTSQIVQNATFLQGVANRRQLPAFTNASANRTVVCHGDSITAGANVTTAWPEAMSLTHTWDIWNLAVSGWRLDTEITPHSTKYWQGPLLAGGTLNVAVVFAGTNDISGAPIISPAGTFANLQIAVTNCLNAGFQTVIVPMLSRILNDANHDTYNSLIFGASWPAGVTVIQASALPDLVPDGSYSNSTYFQGDGIHPTQTGQAEIASAVAAVLNAMG